MKLSTKIRKFVNKTISQRTLINMQAQNELAEEITHGAIQLARNAVTPLGLRCPEIVKELGEALK